MIVVVRMLL